MGEISITIQTRYNVGDYIIFREKSTGEYSCGIIKEISYDKDNHNIEYITTANQTSLQMDILTKIDPKLMKEDQSLIEESLVIQKIRNKIKEHLDALETNKASKSGIISKAEINFGEMICRQCLNFIDEVEKEI